jgi:hypothetical protein
MSSKENTQDYNKYIGEYERQDNITPLATIACHFLRIIVVDLAFVLSYSLIEGKIHEGLFNINVLNEKKKLSRK